MRRHAAHIAMLGILLASLRASAVAEPPSEPEPIGVVRALPEQPGPHWFWLTDLILHRTALFDAALRSRRGDAFAVLSLDHRVYASRYSAVDPSLAPEGESLVQAHAGLAPGEELEDGLARVHEVLDAGFPGWRERSAWERRGVVVGGAGAADPPGAGWRDRPAIDRGGARWLAGDRVSAPGVLSEVSFASARAAARGVLEKSLG